MTCEHFDAIYDGVRAYLARGDVFVVRGIAGADRSHARKFAVVSETPHQALFARQMLIRPSTQEMAAYGMPDFTVLVAPGYRCDPERDGTNTEAVVALNFERRVIIVAGTGYCGEIKKSIFSTMNYLLPVEDGVLPMHCSANMDPATGRTAVFFGLSGTGKTTLSADPARRLHRRRRARLVGQPRLQHRGWLLRQVHRPLRGARARHLPRHPLWQRDRERGARSRDAPARLRRRERDREHARGLSRRAHRRRDRGGHRRGPLGRGVPRRRTPSECCRPSPVSTSTARCTTS